MKEGHIMANEKSLKVLIVDDDKNICDLLRLYLEKDGYSVILSHDGEEAVVKFNALKPDMVLLDIMLPGMDGFTVCRTLRAEGNDVPIVMITAREEETDKVFGLEIGADDYVTKPFSMRELLARVKANMRRTAPPAPGTESGDVIRMRDLVIDMDRHTVSKNGRDLDLTQREYELVRFLAQNPGKVVSRQELMSQVWQYEYFGDLRAVDVAVRRLREKLEDNPAEPDYVRTRRGVGYYFAE